MLKLTVFKTTLLCSVVDVSTGQTIDTLFFPVLFSGTTISVIANDRLPRSNHETMMASDAIIPNITRCGITPNQPIIKQILLFDSFEIVILFIAKQIKSVFYLEKSTN